MGEIKFLNYSNGERFSENYQMLSYFFEKYTGNGLQEPEVSFGRRREACSL